MITDGRMIVELLLTDIARMIADERMILGLLLTDSMDDHRWVDDCGLLLTDSTDDRR